MRTAIIAAALVAGFSTAATAQSNDVAFNGFYAGAQVGVDSFDADVNVKGIAGGIFAGYNHRIDNVVVGLEGQLNLSDADKEIVPGVDLGVREGYGITARAGYLVGSGTLAYVHGGWAKTKFKFTDAVGSISERVDGWKVGAGLETLIADNVTLRAEYAYTDYENNAGFEPKNSSFQVGVAYQF